MERIKIGYFADGPWSHQAFELLIADENVEIKFIIPRTDSLDQTLLKYAANNNIPFHKGVKINSDEFYELAKSYECDLFVSMSFNQIFKERITNLPPLGTINCHAGKLPFYRGRNILNWVLINDETDFGITVHFIDEGIDTGDIILQKTYPITDSDNYQSLLLVAYQECASVLYDSIKLLQNGSYQRLEQIRIHSTGFYCGRREPGDEIIDWNQTSREIFNFIRAISYPGPKAMTYFKGKSIVINNSRLIEFSPTYKSIIGQIVGITESGFIIKTRDSIIEILEVESSLKLKIGDRLGI
jgi:methionyl-tRNA formyltransferase